MTSDDADPAPRGQVPESRSHRLVGRAAKALHINLDPGHREPGHRDPVAPREVSEPTDRSVEVPRKVPAPTSGILEEAVGALPGLLRVTAVTAAQAAGWGLRTSIRSARRIVAATAMSGPTDLSLTAGSMSGSSNGEPTWQPTRPAPSPPTRPLDTPERLRRAGEELLRRSSDVWDEDVRHPAYDAILDELAPDEARILVLLLEQGAQPAVDVVEGGLVGTLRGSRTIARGLTMIGQHAAVRMPSMAPQHLDNLTRLGLVWPSEEPVADPTRYQPLEAQPDVIEAVESRGGARVRRRSIRLTPFGRDFARTCFADAASRGELPVRHATPDA